MAGRAPGPRRLCRDGSEPDGGIAGHDGVADWACGYGYSFWGARHGYRGDGAFGQFAVVLPEQDVAVAITSEVEAMQDVCNINEFIYF